MKKSTCYLVLTVFLMAMVATGGCANSRKNSGKSHKTTAEDTNNIDMTGMWDIVLEDSNGRWDIKMDLKQNGEQLRGLYIPTTPGNLVDGTFMSSSFGNSPIRGTVDGNDFIIKVELTTGFLLKITGRANGAAAKGESFYGPRRVAWNSTWMSNMYDSVAQGEFTAQRQ